MSPPSLFCFTHKPVGQSNPTRPTHSSCPPHTSSLTAQSIPHTHPRPPRPSQTPLIPFSSNVHSFLSSSSPASPCPCPHTHHSPIQHTTVAAIHIPNNIRNRQT